MLTLKDKQTMEMDSELSEQQIVEEQRRMQPTRIFQYNIAFNGLFTYVGAPREFDVWNYGPDNHPYHWRFSCCLTDNFGNLQPADPFYYGHEEEQIDVMLDFYWDGFYGIKLSKVIDHYLKDIIDDPDRYETRVINEKMLKGRITNITLKGEKCPFSQQPLEETLYHISWENMSSSKIPKSQLGEIWTLTK